MLLFLFIQNKKKIVFELFMEYLGGRASVKMVVRYRKKKKKTVNTGRDGNE